MRVLYIGTGIALNSAKVNVTLGNPPPLLEGSEL